MKSVISEPNNLRGNLLFQSIPNFMKILKKKEKIEKVIFDFEIIPFELVLLNTRFYWERILVIGCQYVKKQSQDYRYY